MRSLNIAATGMLAQQLNVEVISNNIANMNTTAFKRQRAEFQDLLYQEQERVGSSSSDTGTIVPAGTIVTTDGYEIAPGLTIPTNAVSVTINPSGEVLAKVAGTVEPQNVGQLSLTNFANEAGLEAIGDNLFLETPASGGAVGGLPGTPGFGTILQGFVESSNVNVVQEVTNLITAQRAYEMNSKVIEASDEMMRSLTQMR
jgi:flagellar basal-body rod protein FlgG